MELISQTRIFSYNFDHTIVSFKETAWGSITPLPSQENAPLNGAPSPTFLKLVKVYQEEAKKIRKKCGANLSNHVELDFSNLGLTQLPPHILLECKKARHLDISDNDIHFLPIQLRDLPLISLDISGNTRLQPNIPEWLGEMPGLTLVAQNMDLSFIPKGLTQKQVVSDDLPKGVTFGQTQYIHYTNDES